MATISAATVDLDTVLELASKVDVARKVLNLAMAKAAEMGLVVEVETVEMSVSAPKLIVIVSLPLNGDGF